MKKYSLVKVGGVKYIEINAENVLKNFHCNSSIFKNKKDSDLNISIFEYTNTEHETLKKLDMRFKKSKQLIEKYGYFSVSKIKSPLLNN